MSEQTPETQFTKRSLVVGAGEVGTGLYEVLRETYGANVQIRDIEEPTDEIGKVDYLHICIPFKNFSSFKKAVNGYVRKYKPSITVIHSTVPVGTTRRLGERFVHSPIRGKHPHLAEGIRTFTKFVGSVIADLTTGNVPANEIAAYFIGANIQSIVFNRSETTELGKIMETTQYGWFIALAKEIKRVCDVQGLDFTEVYTIHNQSYNEGYAKLGLPQYCRPVLEPVPGPIGGHCVVPNAKLLSDRTTQLVKHFNRIFMEQNR